MKKVILILTLLTISFSAFAPESQPVIDSHYWPPYRLPAQVTTDIRVFQLQMSLMRMVTIPCYHRQGKLTFCNVGARDLLDNRNHSYWGKTYGFMLDDFALDLSPVFPTAFSILRLSIKDAYSAALKAVWQKRIERITCRQAYERARRGEIVWVISAKYNHEAIVYPDMRPWNDERGCRIAQCGYYNTIRDISHKFVFGKRWKDPEIMFIVFKRRSA